MESAGPFFAVLVRKRRAAPGPTLAIDLYGIFEKKAKRVERFFQQEEPDSADRERTQTKDGRIWSILVAGGAFNGYTRATGKLGEIAMQHPQEVLFQDKPSLPDIAPCDHYAGNERFIRKAFELQNARGPVFDITCDMEDGAQAGREVEHAHMLAGMLASDLNQYRCAGVRLHPPSTDFWEDELRIIMAAAGRLVSHVVIPKVKGPDDVFLVIERLGSFREEFGIEREIPLHVMIETQDALQSVFEIGALPHIRCLDLGIMDLISSYDGVISFDCAKSPGQFEHALLRRAKAMIVAAASANCVVASHNPTVRYADPGYALQDARRAREEFGFMRMWSIHPSQIDPILDAMAPSKTELSKAASLLTVAQQENWGPISFEGELHDRASYRYYWQLLKRAKRTGMNIPDSAEALMR